MWRRDGYCLGVILLCVANATSASPVLAKERQPLQTSSLGSIKAGEFEVTTKNRVTGPGKPTPFDSDKITRRRLSLNDLSPIELMKTMTPSLCTDFTTTQANREFRLRGVCQTSNGLHRNIPILVTLSYRFNEVHLTSEMQLMGKTIEQNRIMRRVSN